MGEQKFPDWVKTSDDYERWKKGETTPKDAFDVQFEKALSSHKNRSTNIRLLIIVGIGVFLLCGFGRIYTGGGIGFKVMGKQSFSFKDTFVNLDDLMGMPRIAVAAQHPSVKRQLEDMGIIESDEEVERKIRKKIEAETEAITERFRRQLN